MERNITVTLEKLKSGTTVEMQHSKRLHFKPLMKKN